MFGITWKKVTTAENNRTKEVDAVQLWFVRWTSRYGEFSHCIRPEVEAFASAEDAKDFAKALSNAFKLIKHSSHTEVKVTRE